MGKLAAMPRLGAAPVSRAHPWLGSPAGPPGAGGGEVDRNGGGSLCAVCRSPGGNLLTPAQVSTPLKGLRTSRRYGTSKGRWHEQVRWFWVLSLDGFAV